MQVRCTHCKTLIPRSIAHCPACHRGRSHKDCYPEQYGHPLVGKRVRVVTPQKAHVTEGVVERVVDSRFGQLAHLEGADETFWRVADCRPV